MKAVFPCKGVIVITKQNVDILSNFYEGSLINSKLYSAYIQNNFAVQVGKFNYLPQNSKITLDKNAKLLTIRELNNVLSKAVESEKATNKAIPDKKDAPIEDNFIMNHPFFQTLKPID